MATADAIRVATARRWYRRQGYAATVEGEMTAVCTPAHPKTWDANWVQAGPGATPDAVFAAFERDRSAGSQVVVVDALTSPAVEAALALAGFRPEVTVIEMVASGPIVAAHPLPAIEIEPVDDANWTTFEHLVDIDQREGKRTGEHESAVATGLIDSMRRRRATCDYWLLREGDAVAGYGMTAICPGGLGLIESLFTLPERRGRGLMSAFIGQAADRLRAAGCDAVFLDAHAHDTPKRLYARLGFAPVAVTRTWVRRREG